MVHSVAGELDGGALTDRRPFRAPHHSASMAALVGGGVHAKPGEISLAHNGVLFLDELPEFNPQALDSLRQPIEAGEVAIARANHRVVYPARFQLVAAMNPCRCGQADEPGYACKRGPNARCVAQYQARLSGPLLDRFDLTIDVPAVAAADLLQPPPREGSARSPRGWRRRARSRSSATARSGSGDGRLQRRGAGQRRRADRRARSGGAGAAARRRRADAACRRAAITACSSSRARSPISTAPRRSRAPISPRR